MFVNKPGQIKARIKIAVRDMAEVQFARGELAKFPISRGLFSKEENLRKIGLVW